LIVFRVEMRDKDRPGETPPSRGGMAPWGHKRRSV
jgi:hypothetical protein